MVEAQPDMDFAHADFVPLSETAVRAAVRGGRFSGSPNPAPS